MRVSWKQLESYIDICYKQLQGRKVEKIIAVPTSGLIPAQLLANRLKIKDIYLWKREKLTFENALFVDDICDTGKTFKDIYEIAGPNVLYCAPLTRLESEFTALITGKWVVEDSYIYMPWEVDEWREKQKELFKTRS